MKTRNLNLMDIRELLIQMRAQSSDRQVARDTGHHRNTVKRYRDWAESQGLLAGELPAPGRTPATGDNQPAGKDPTAESIFGRNLSGTDREVGKSQCGSGSHTPTSGRERLHRQLCGGLALCAGG